MKATSNQKKLIKIITMPIRVLNKGKEMYVRSMMKVAQKPRYGSVMITSRSSGHRNEDLRNLVRAYSASNMGCSSIDLFLEQVIKEEQMKKLKELMERNNFSKSKSLRRVSKCYRNVAMGKIDEEEEVEEILTSNGVKKFEGLYLRSKSYGFRRTNTIGVV